MKLIFSHELQLFFFFILFLFYLYTKTTVRLKGLDAPAPALQTLVDWSLQNFVAVGLGSSVYLSSVSKVTKLYAWSSTLFASGGCDHAICMRDLHAASPFVSKMTGHEQEGCGFKWSFDDQQVRRSLFCCL